MGVCENQYKFVKEYALDKINKPDVQMLELGDQVLNNHQNFFNHQNYFFYLKKKEHQ